jgi:hypothetical protein
MSVGQTGQSDLTTRIERTSSVQATMLPSLVVHADWGTAPKKRWMTSAIRAGDRYTVGLPEPVGDTSTLLRRFRSIVLEGPVIIGFDFPIGVAASYAREAGVDDFLAWLPRLGAGKWVRFYDVAEQPEEISIHRPFYPFRPGGTRLCYLLDALRMGTADDLLRQCERPHEYRPAASPLFWTLGPKQVGKAAISGWRDVLEPGLREPELAVAIWPFSGFLSELLRPGRLVVVETYPEEFYRHLRVVWSSGLPAGEGGKGSQNARAASAPALLTWADRSGVDLHPILQDAIRNGFGPLPSGEDQFDATIGLFGMLNILLGYRVLDEPQGEEIRKIEGWIFGQRAT